VVRNHRSRHRQPDESGSAQQKHRLVAYVHAVPVI